MAAVAPSGTENRIDLGVPNKLHQLGRPPLIGAGEIAVPVEDIIACDGLEAESLERGATRRQGLRIDGTGRGRNGDPRTGPNGPGSTKARH